MPPNAKFTKDEITAAALEIVRREGIGVLTARALGAKLGSSARPVFTVFRSMDEVQEEVMRAARDMYNRYVQSGLSQVSPGSHQFKNVGEQYIRFSIEEPKLFQLLFMREQENIPDIDGILPMIDANYEDILASIQNEYGLDRQHSHRLYQHLWIYTHGIASLCATKMCRFTGEEIGKMMTEIFLSILEKVKG